MVDTVEHRAIKFGCQLIGLIPKQRLS